MKNNLDTPVAKQCRALYTKYAYGHTYGLLKVCLWWSSTKVETEGHVGRKEDQGGETCQFWYQTLPHVQQHTWKTWLSGCGEW